MRDNRDNALLLSGIVVGTFLLTVAWVTALQSSAAEIFQGVCSLIGGAVGAGGAALAVFLTLRGQQEDERIQTLTSLYFEIAGYLWPSGNSHSAIADAYRRHSGDTNQADNFTQVMLRSALNMQPPVYFPAHVARLARLNDPQTINAFYVQLDIMRIQKGRPGMENAETAPNRTQLKTILMALGTMMMVEVRIAPIGGLC